MPPKAKNSQGIVIVVDVGKDVRASTDTSFYTQSKQCLINILQRKIFSEKCYDLVGIVLFGTDNTSNNLHTPGQYENIMVLQTMKIVDWDMIALVENLPRGNRQADWLSAVVVALDILHENERNDFTSKKIVLMTDFSMNFSDDQVDKISSGLKYMNIEFCVIGPSVDDIDNGASYNGNLDDEPSTSDGNPSEKSLNWNGKPKSQCQRRAERVLLSLVNEVDGICYSFEEAIPQLLFYEKKSQSSAKWNACLSLGHSLNIPVCGRIKIKRSAPTSWKKVYAKDPDAAVRSEVSYCKNEEDLTPIHQDDIISGYKYGSTVVPFNEEDAQLKYDSNAQGAELSIVGFTKSQNSSIENRSGDQVLIVTARDDDEDAAVALSAFIQGLYELDMVAITRRVYRRNLNPSLGVLYPYISSDCEYLVWIALPFAEDVRNCALPSLQKAKEKLSDDQIQTMDDFIDALSLDKDKDCSDYDPTQTLNPHLQNFFTCLTQRAIYPDLTLSTPPDHILKILSASEESQKMKEEYKEKLSSSFPTQIKKQKKEENTIALVPTPSTSTDGLPLSKADLMKSRVTKITTVSPAQDFRAMLQGTQPNYTNICEQMENVAYQMIDQMGSSTSDAIFIPKITEALKAYREEASIIDPTKYNSLVENIKTTVKARQLNQLWLIIEQDKLGLVNKEESLKSKYSVEEASAFYTIEEEPLRVQPPPEDDVEYDDLIDDL